jgi:tetratricopeptide (TPR) repeat protein
MKNYKSSINCFQPDRSLTRSQNGQGFIVEVGVIKTTSSTRFALVNRRAKHRTAFALCVGLGFLAFSSTVYAQDAVQAQETKTQSANTEESTPPPTITLPAVTPPAVVAPAATPLSSATPASATAPVTSSATAATVGSTSINVLLVPLDEIAAVPPVNASSPAAPTDASTTEIGGVVEGTSASQAVGASERAAAPLRRALMSRGLSDVLSAAPDSSVLRRAVVEGRLSARVISDLQSAMKELAATSTVSDSIPVKTSPAATDDTSTGAESNATPGAVGDAVTSPITSTTLRSASISQVSGPRRKASEAAARIGRLLGYRAVVAFSVVNDTAGARAVFLLVDSARETGVVVVPAIAATSGRAFSLAAADAGSTLLQRQLQTWDAVSVTEKTRLSQGAETRARALLEAGEVAAAREELNVVLASDPTRIDLYELLGDVLLKSGDTSAAVTAYRRVLETQPEGQRGAIWVKTAQAYAGASNWPETLNAAEQALTQKHDSLELRLAMAQAQIGRARLFEDASRPDSAFSALEDAENHLRKATEFSASDVRIARLQVQHLTMQNRTREALMVLDRVASQFPNDGELQANYANSLLGRVGRESEAFAAWSRAWNILSKNGAQPNSKALSVLPAPDRLRYRRLADGFDLFVGNAAKSVYTITERVLDGSMTREDALLKARAPLAQILAASETLKALQPPDDRVHQSHLTRIEAASKLTEAVAAYSLFLESGEESYRDRAVESHKAAVSQLNSLRQNM